MGGLTLDNSFTTKYENEPCKTGERVDHWGFVSSFYFSLTQKTHFCQTEGIANLTTHHVRVVEGKNKRNVGPRWMMIRFSDATSICVYHFSKHSLHFATHSLDLKLIKGNILGF